MARLDASVAEFEKFDRWGFRYLPLALRAIADAMRGKPGSTDAAKAAEPPYTRTLDWVVGIAGAWAHAARGDIVEARRSAVAGRRMACTMSWLGALEAPGLRSMGKREVRCNVPRAAWDFPWVNSASQRDASRNEIDLLGRSLPAERGADLRLPPAACIIVGCRKPI